MYLFLGVCLLPALLTSVAGWGKKSSVVNVGKLYDTSQLTSKVFHQFNSGRLLFYYATGVTKGEAAKLSSINDLQYAGKILVGSNNQQLNVIFDPAVADLLVLSHSMCTMLGGFCRKHGTYNEKKSFNAKTNVRIPWEIPAEPKFVLFKDTLQLKGHFVFDQIKIEKMVVPQADCVIGAIDQGEVYGKADGVLGIGRRADSYFSPATIITNSEADRMSIINHPLQEALSRLGASKIGVHLYKAKKTGKEVGQVIFGAEKETKRHKGQLSWVPQPDVQGPYWRIPVSEIKVTRKAVGGSGTGTMEKITLDPTEGLAVPDPGTSLIAGPTELVDAINQLLFKGMELFKGASDFGTVQFECQHVDKLPNVVFVVGGQEYVLEPDVYVRRVKSVCTSGFMGVPKLQSLVLGDPFFQKHYVVFDSVNNKIGLAESK